MRRRRILNGTFDVVSVADTLDWIRAHVRGGRLGWMCTINVANLMMMRSDSRLQSFADRSALAVTDGQPLIWYSRLRGPVLPARVTGVNLVELLAGLAAEEGFRVYFLGARRHVVEEVTRRLAAKYLRLEIAGFADGYFDADEAAARARAIAASKADILIAGMGVPRQERFLEDHWEELGVSLAIPVGGSFEVLAGEKKRAPGFVQRLGLEWLYRLAQEPRRLWKRYLGTNARFLVLILLELITGPRGEPVCSPLANSIPASTDYPTTVPAPGAAEREGPRSKVRSVS